MSLTRNPVVSRLLVASALAALLVIAWNNRSQINFLQEFRSPGPAGIELAVQTLSAEDLRAIVPAWQGRPTVLEFTSQLCKDCQRMKGDMSRLATTYQGRVQTVVVDVARPTVPVGEQLLNKFQPLVTPTIILISPDLAIKDVLIGYQPPQQLRSLYQRYLAPVAPQ